MNSAIGVELSEVGQAVFSKLLEFGEATRKMLSEGTSLSFPTVTLALGELTAKGMVCELRREQGARGRATIVYGASDEAGWVMGVDIGSTQVSVIARALNGRILGRSTKDCRNAPVEQGKLAGELVAVFRQRPGTLPLAIGVAMNQVVPRRLIRDDGSKSRALQICEAFVQSSGLPGSIPILLENNVNCAAVAEQQDGLMIGHQDAAYMQIGVGIGLGFFSDGSLIRGGQGASGELAQIPVSWENGAVSGVDAIERRYGSLGIMERAASLWEEGQRPQSPEELFAIAATGDERAQALMVEHGVALGRIAAAVSTILDPSILVVGGGLSRNEDFARIILEEFRLRSHGTVIEISKKGAEVTVTGACMLARDLALRQIVDKFHKPLLSRPTLLQAALRH